MIPNPFRTQIAQLIEANVATHIIENNQSVDALFALSKARDFPQVKFAAAFDDGTVVIGCHDDLPEPLARIAKRVTITDDDFADELLAHKASEAKADLDSAAILEKLDQLDRNINQLAPPAVAETDLLARFDQIDATVRSAQQELTTIYADASRSGDLAAQLTEIQQALGHIPDFKSLTDPIASGQKQILDAIGTSVASEPTSEISNMLSVFEANIRAELAATEPLQKLAEQTAALIKGQGETQQRLSHIGSELETALVRHPQDNADAHESDDRTGTVLDAKLDDVLLAITNLSQAAASRDAIVEMQSQIAELSSKPSPKPDLTEQRQITARFQTAMATVLSRLEDAIETISQPTSANAPPNDDIIQAITTQFAALTDQIAPVLTLPDQIQHVSGAINDLPDRTDALAKAVTALSERPDPVIDLTEQRRTLTSFADVLNVNIKRLEKMAEVFAQGQDQSKTADELAEIRDHLANIPATGSDETLKDILAEQTQEFGLLRDDVATHANRPAPVLDLTQQRASFAQFSTAIGTMIKRLESVTETLMHPAEQSDAPPEIACDASVAVDVDVEVDEPASEPAIGLDDNPDLDKVLHQADDPSDIPFSGDFDATALSLLRTNLAELVASQMMEKALK